MKIENYKFVVYPMDFVKHRYKITQNHPKAHLNTQFYPYLSLSSSPSLTTQQPSPPPKPHTPPTKAPRTPNEIKTKFYSSLSWPESPGLTFRWWRKQKNSNFYTLEFRVCWGG